MLIALNRYKRAFDQDDISFLEQVACQVAIAVENALDYEKAIGDRDKETKQRIYLERKFALISGKSSGTVSR
jgi:formate hydrogenlyase transcriptional activator